MSIVRPRHAAVLALMGSTMLASAPLYAQAAADSANGDEIVVTAQKREQNLQDVPMAVTAIGTERLDQLQVKEFQDVVKNLPSVTIQTAGPGFSRVFFRGVASGENGNHSASLPTVGTYLDEMPITTIQGALDIHAYDLARVEALAGPQGTLYGASSMAGTIKLVSNAPDTSATYGEIGAELNAVTHGEAGGVLEGFLNARLSDNAAARIVGWYRRDGGYIDNIAGSRTYPTSGVTDNNAELVEADYNDVETYGARLALGIDLNDDWTLKPTVMGQIQKSWGSFSQERGTATPKKLTTIQYNPESARDKWLQAALTIEGKIGNWDVVTTGGLLRRKVNTESDYSDYAYFYDSIFGSGYYVQNNAGDFISPNQYIKGQDKYKKEFVEFRVSSPQEASIRLIAGLFYQRQQHDILQNYIIDGLADNLKVPGTTSNVWLTNQVRVDRDYAAFGELSFDATDKLTLTAGGRLYKYKNSLVGFFGFSQDWPFSSGVKQCFGPAVVPGSPCTNVDKVTKDTDAIFKLNATYKINDDALIYATWSRGFRPGGINRRGTLPPYGPDSIDNYEIGWKTTWADGAVRFNGAIYQLDWSDIQISLLGASGLTQIQNAGSARIRGIEADLSYSRNGLTLGGSFSYNDAELTFPFCEQISTSPTCATPTGNSILAPSGTQLPVTAKFKGNALARYEFPVGDWEGHAQLAVNHIGNRRGDLRASVNALIGDYGAYTTADISFGVKNESWSAEFFATNLFDSNGVVNAGVQCVETVCGDAGGDTARGGIFYDNVIKPRVVGVKVARKF